MVPVLLAVIGGLPKLELTEVLSPWTNSVVATSLAAGAVATVFIPGSSTRPAQSTLLALGAMVGAAVVGLLSRGRFARVSTVLLPATIPRFTANTGSLGALPFDQQAVSHWLADDAWPAAVFTATVAAVAFASVPAEARPARSWRWLILGADVAGTPPLGVSGGVRHRVRRGLHRGALHTMPAVFLRLPGDPSPQVHMHLGDVDGGGADLVAGPAQGSAYAGAARSARLAV